jgi:hypothetical protein
MGSQALPWTAEVVWVRLLMNLRSNRIRTWIAQFGLMALVLVFTACASSGRPNSQTTPRTDKVAVLGGVADLRERFNEDSGKVRLVLLISPT